MRIQNQIEELHRNAGRISDYWWNLVSTATTQGATLLAAVILTRLLTVESFGRYAIGQTTVAALSSVFSLGLGFVANALLARSSTAARQASIHRFCLTVVAVSGVTAGALVAGGSMWLARHLFHDSSIQPILLLAGLAIPFGAVGTYQAGALAGTRMFHGLAAAAAAGGACLLVGVSIGASAAAASGALVGLGLAHAVRGLVSGLVLRTRGSSLRGRPDLSIGETWGNIRQFVLPTVLSAFTGMPAIWLATAVLTTHADTRAVGVFASAFLMKSLVTFVPLQFGSVLLSRLSMLSAKGDVAAWRRTHTSVLIAGIGIALLLALPLTLFSGQVMASFGADYRDGALLLRWLMLCAVFEAAATLAYYAFPSQGTFWKAALAYSLPKDLVLVVAAIPLVMRFEALGLALAHTMSWVYGMLALTLLSWLDRRPGTQAAPLTPASFGANGPEHDKR